MVLAIIFRDDDGGVFSSRWWGILGLIGWIYFLCAFIYLFVRDRLRYLFAAWLLLVLTCLFMTPTREGISVLNLPGVNFFSQILSILHIGNGALSVFTISGVLLSVVGVRYANKIKRGLYKWLLGGSVVSLLLYLAGVMSHQYWITSKLGDTPSWVFYCCAIAVGSYFLLYWLEINSLTGWSKFIAPAGTATLTCYLIPYVLYSVFSLINIDLPAWTKAGLMGIFNSVLFSFITIAFTYFLGKIHIKLKI